MQNKDSISNTFQVAGALCIVCSLLVSLTAVGLRPVQKENVVLDKKKNILLVAGFSAEEVRRMDANKIDSYFNGQNEEIEIRDTLINLTTGKEPAPELKNIVLAEAKADSIAEFDPEKIQKKISKSIQEPENQLSRQIDPAKIGLKTVENYSHVYTVIDKKSGQVRRYVFPVKGKGLWSTLYGFLAVDAECQTIMGLTFYKHGETPGLGGEVDNPKWKKQWEGRLIHDESGQLPEKYVIKGGAPPENRNAVDGLSGATITSKGVSQLVRFWLSEDGFGKFMELATGHTSQKHKTSGASADEPHGAPGDSGKKG